MADSAISAPGGGGHEAPRSAATPKASPKGGEVVVTGNAPAGPAPPSGGIDAVTTRNKVAASLQILIALETTVLGLVYWTSSQLIPYHSDAVATRWEDMTAEWQALIVAFYRLVGCTMCIQALYLLGFGVRAIASGGRWSRWMMVAFQGAHWGPMLHASLEVQRCTAAETPWRFAALYGLMSVSSFLIGHTPGSNVPRHAVMAKGEN